MSSIRSYSRRAGSLFAVAALVLATITPGLVPSFASAAQLTERSIALSSAATSATAVTYDVDFTPATTAGSLIIDFCSNSPLVGAECVAPTGFTAASAASTDASSIGLQDSAVNTLVIETTLTATTAKSLEITGINNPTVEGPLYVRITTYPTNTAGTEYQSAQAPGNYSDEAGAAVSIVDKINVSGAVLESMTFCIAGPTPDLTPGNEGQVLPTTITDNCANSGSLPAPSLRLGKKTGDIIALDNEVSTGSLYGQISTNASTGAIVNLKSNATGCGGLLRAGDATNACDIAPAQKTDITDGQAKFGAKIVAADPLALIGQNDYNATTFTLNYNNTTSGVTSAYGDPFFNTADGPVSNENLEIIFGAAVAPNTPAGLYRAELSLIATGKF